MNLSNRIKTITSLEKKSLHHVAVANEKYSNHIKNSFRKVINCRVLPQFAPSFDYTYITKRAKCSKSRQIEAINRNKNVVKIRMYYYFSFSNKSIHVQRITFSFFYLLLTILGLPPFPQE